MIEAEYLRDLGETTLERLRVLHLRFTGNGDTRYIMHALFGFPNRCLICAKPLRWELGKVPDDVDPWFCAGHCPICMNDAELFDDYD
jgi:hypothetical protein